MQSSWNQYQLNSRRNQILHHHICQIITRNRIWRTGKNFIVENLKCSMILNLQKRDILSRTKQARDALRIDNHRLRQSCGLLGNEPLLRDFEERKDEGDDLRERLEKLKMTHAELTLNCNQVRRKIEQARQNRGWWWSCSNCDSINMECDIFFIDIWMLLMYMYICKRMKYIWLILHDCFHLFFLYMTKCSTVSMFVGIAHVYFNKNVLVYTSM